MRCTLFEQLELVAIRISKRMGDILILLLIQCFLNDMVIHPYLLPYYRTHNLEKSINPHSLLHYCD